MGDFSVFILMDTVHPRAGAGAGWTPWPLMSVRSPGSGAGMVHLEVFEMGRLGVSVG